MILQPLADIAALCAARHVTNFILSPGSRCAPLTLALVRHAAIHTRTVSDERSAAFIALGMAQASGQTVGLVCTSGTAALNYAPAVAEAFYQQIPLLILTADRPPEWIDQQDGQAIHQQEIYGKHIKASYQLPADYTHPDAVSFINRVVNEAINLTQTYPFGPVHINVPIREPFYPEADETMTFDEQPRVIEEIKNEAILSRPSYMNLANEWLAFPRKMIVVGQHSPDLALQNALYACGLYNQTPVVADIIANMHQADGIVSAHDLFLMSKEETMPKNLQPELLITVGNSLISKNLKQFLRKNKPKQHWHIQEAGKVADTFGTLTRIVRSNPTDFFTKMGEQGFFTYLDATPNPFYTHWQQYNSKAKTLLESILGKENKTVFNEFSALAQVMPALPEDSHLHLANSMSVRYANFLSLEASQRVGVWANRGTSGIDGSTSTAVGFALTTNKIVTLITGDVAFFYDRNALWHNYLPANLRIILLNNNGGGIFQMIDGPARQPEATEYFATRQTLNAEQTCIDANMKYSYCADYEQLTQMLNGFFVPSLHAQLLEIGTNTADNVAFFAKVKKTLAELK